MDLIILRAWIVLKKHLLCWVVICGRMTLDLVKVDIVDIYKFTNARLYGKNLSLHSPSLELQLGNWGMLGTVES